MDFNFALDYTIRKVRANQRDRNWMGQSSFSFALVMLTYWGKMDIV